METGELSGRSGGRLSLLLVLATNLVLFVTCLFWLTLQYQTNDDVGMNMFAMGQGLAQQPSEFLMFQHFIPGLFLKFLYSHLPGIPWYGTMLLVYLLLSSLTIGYSLLRLAHHPSVVGLWLMGLILFYLSVILSPQFTLCSGYLGIAGILLLYSSVCKPHASRATNISVGGFAFGLLILASLVRFEGLLLVVLLMAPLYVNTLVNHFTVALRRLLPIVCCAVFFATMLNWGQLAYYSHSPGWEQFYRYNRIRADFIDNDRIVWNENTRPVFEKIGWSHNDFSMIRSWFYMDSKVYSLENLLFISDHIPVVPGHKLAWRPLFQDLKGSLLSYPGIAMLLLYVWLLIKGSVPVRMCAALAFVWYCALFLSIGLLAKSPPMRVWLVMLFCLYGIGLVLWCQVCEWNRPRTLRKHVGNTMLAIAAVAVSVVFCRGQIMEVIRLSDEHKEGQKSLQSDLTRLKPRRDQLFVVWAADFPYEEFQLPTRAEPIAPDMQLLGLGVGNHEPFVQGRLKSFGIDDLYQSLYTREDVFLISSDWENELLIQYIQEHYGTRVEVHEQFRGTKFTVNKVRRLIAQ